MKIKIGRILFVVVPAVFMVSCWSMGANTGGSQDRTTNERKTPTNEKNETAVSKPNENKMTIETKTDGFNSNLPAGFNRPTDEVGRKLLGEYGAVFLARGGARPPGTVVFRDEAEVSGYQNGLDKASANIGGISLELQAPAMKALNNAIGDAGKESLTISPRGADSARRGYTETVGLWKSRVDPGFVHWVAKGRVTQAEADRIKKLSSFEQVSEILKLESQGIFFAKDLSKSIIYSVAPPGTSQHISMLALDVKEFENPRVRSILANNGWFQTVVSDLPHFTFLGAKAAELPGLGLKKVNSDGRDFWVPDI